MRKTLLLVLAVFAAISSASQCIAITRSEVIARAKVWADAGVAYSQSAYRDSYRTDCSGYVSYCWAFVDNNGNPYSFTANTSWSPLLGERSFAISKDDLQSGDALLRDGAVYSGGHILLFDRWDDSNRTHFWAYEMGYQDPGDPLGYDHSMRATYRLRSYSSCTNYNMYPIRYVGISDGPQWEGHLDSPVSGGEVAGTVHISGWAKQTAPGFPPIQWVEIFINGEYIGNAPYNDPVNGTFIYDWDSRPWAGQTVSILTRPTTWYEWWDDLHADGVVVGPAFEGHLDTPTSGSGVGGTVLISGWAKETSGKFPPIQWVEIFINGEYIGNAPYNDPVNGTFSYEWDSRLWAGQTVSILTRPTTWYQWWDELHADNVVVGPAWEGHLDTPASGTGVGGTVRISGWAKQTAPGYPPIQWVEIFINGEYIGNAPYNDPVNGTFSFDWDSRPWAGQTVTVLTRPTTWYQWWDGLQAEGVIVGAAFEGHVDTPAPNSGVSGTVHISGWAKQTAPGYPPIQWVEIFINGTYIGHASYDDPTNGTFSYDWDSRPWAGQTVTIITRPTTWYQWSDEIFVGGIVVSAPLPVADFSADLTSGTVPLTVQFTDQSANAPTSWSWTFGDGATATVANPSHAYTVAGTYTVALTVANVTGSDTNTKSDYITGNPPAPIADFSAIPTSGAAPLTVAFTDLSTNDPTSWSWNFGEGGTSTAQSPSHNYAAGGSFTVALTATNAGGSDTESKTGYIAVNSFSDVLTDNWAWAEVEACVAADIVAGYGDGTYHPEYTVTRDQMAVFVARALAGGDSHVPDGAATSPFSDVLTDHWAYKYISYAYDNNIVQGYPDGTYGPGLNVNRAQMAAFIARSIASPLGEAGLAAWTAPTTPSFADVPTDFWTFKHIEYLKEYSVVAGYPDGLYHPEFDVTRDQMAVFVARAFGLL